ncbi:MAG: hypothetical protein K0R01_158 [Mycobacterium sp.]|jgi:hypothetical protein|nr:hypothetical protein [Mycobacterium sp.]
MTTLPGLDFGPETPQNVGRYGEGETERETRAALAEIEKDTPLTGVKRTAKTLALSLARSIDAGNAKGRAVANEAAQLFAMMQQLAPAEDPNETGDDSHLTPETRRLLDAFAAPAQLDAAPVRDGA